MSSEPRRSARNAGKPIPAPVVKKTTTKRAAPEKKQAASKKTKKDDKEEEKEVESPAAAPDAVESAAADVEEEEDEPVKKASTKELEVGDVLPEIILKNEKGADVDVSKLAGEKGVVFFLYPKAATPGCTNQACLYRDSKDDFGELGYAVYGLSKDKPTAQQSWITKQSLNYSLLSDPSSELIKALGAFAAPSSTKRSHFIFEKASGKLIDKAVGVKPANDSANALDFIKKHHA